MDGRRWAYDDLSADELDAAAKSILDDGIEELKDAQELLWASDTYALLVVFQAIDAAGKDSTIKHVMSGVNPQGVRSSRSSSRPARSSTTTSSGALEGAPGARPDRDLQPVPLRGGGGGPGAPRVARQAKLPARRRVPLSGPGRHEDINAFERQLDRTGTKVVKFFLHVSKAEQKRRFMARLDDPGKQWKFSAATSPSGAAGTTT